MNEAAKLVDMAVAAMFAAMVLVAASVLITLSYFMWSYFAKQDAANQRMQEYANFSSFDNTTVRGQEVVQLIENHYDDIFILIYDSNPEPSRKDINNQNVQSNPIAVCAYSSTQVSEGNYTDNAITTLSNAMNAFKGWARPGKDIQSLQTNPGTLDLTSMVDLPTDAPVGTHTLLTNAFLGRDLSKPDSVGNYAAFKSCLVYDNDRTSDIVGIILVRESKHVNKY